MPMNITFSEGSGLNDSIYGKCQAPIRMFLEQRGEQFEQQSVIKDLFLMGTSDNYGDMMTTMTAMDGFQPVGENGAYPADGMQEGYNKMLIYETWKDSFSVSREMIEDGKLLDMKKQPAAFMTSYNRTRELFGAALYGGAIKGQSSVKFRGKTFDNGEYNKYQNSMEQFNAHYGNFVRWFASTYEPAQGYVRGYDCAAI